MTRPRAIAAIITGLLLLFPVVTRADITTTSTATFTGMPDDMSSATAPPGTSAYSSAFRSDGAGNDNGDGLAIVAFENSSSASGGGNTEGDLVSRAQVGSSFGVPQVGVSPTLDSPDLFGTNSAVFTTSVSGPGTLSAIVDRMILEIVSTDMYPESAQIAYTIDINSMTEFGFTASFSDSVAAPVLSDLIGDGPFPDFVDQGSGFFRADPLDISLAVGDGPSSIKITATTTASTTTGDLPSNRTARAQVGDPPRFDPNDRAFDPAFQGGFQFQPQTTAVPEPGSLLVWLGIASIGLMFGWRRRS